MLQDASCTCTCIGKLHYVKIDTVGIHFGSLDRAPAPHPAHDGVTTTCVRGENPRFGIVAVTDIVSSALDASARHALDILLQISVVPSYFASWVVEPGCFLLLVERVVFAHWIVHEVLVARILIVRQLKSVEATVVGVHKSRRRDVFAWTHCEDATPPESIVRHAWNGRPHIGVLSVGARVLRPPLRRVQLPVGVGAFKYTPVAAVVCPRPRNACWARTMAQW